MFYTKNIKRMEYVKIEKVEEYIHNFKNGKHFNKICGDVNEYIKSFNDYYIKCYLYHSHF